MKDNVLYELDTRIIMDITDMLILTMMGIS